MVQVHCVLRCFAVEQDFFVAELKRFSCAQFSVWFDREKTPFFLEFTSERWKILVCDCFVLQVRLSGQGMSDS